MRAYCTFASKQAVSILYIGPYAYRLTEKKRDRGGEGGQSGKGGHGGRGGEGGGGGEGGVYLIQCIRFGS